jgi:hypothetical protein
MSKPSNTPNRRRFLARSFGAGLGATLALESQANPLTEGIPDEREFRNWITPETQRAVDQGLAYLAKDQNADSSFGERGFRGNIAITSLAGLALMAGGHQPGRGTYGSNVTRALRFVLSKEQKSPAGLLNNNPDFGPSRQGIMYSHGFGTLFLCEVYGMVNDLNLQKRLRGTIERAVRLIESTQNNEGGWRYDPKPDQADVSVTICQIMALRAARNAGFPVRKDVVDRCVKYVRACQTSDGGFTYFSNQPTGSAFPRSAAGVVALYSAGIYEGKEIERGLNYLLKYKPNSPLARREMEMHYYYGQYYAAQAMWTAGGRYWSEWFPAVRDDLLERRSRINGCWTDPTICSHYATAMACIVLQIPNNYLPILQK